MNSFFANDGKVPLQYQTLRFINCYVIDDLCQDSKTTAC
jgi:hypothetical protein